MTTHIRMPRDLLDLLDWTMGTTGRLTVSQQQVNLFADATGNHQWIHVDPDRAKSGRFGATIAHGYLTLSLAPRFLAEVLSTSSSSRPG